MTDKSTQLAAQACGYDSGRCMHGCAGIAFRHRRHVSRRPQTSTRGRCACMSCLVGRATTRARAPAHDRACARAAQAYIREQRVRFDRGRESCCAEDAFVGHGFGFLSALRAPLPARPQTRRGDEAVACTSRRRVCQSAALHIARKARLPGTLAPWPHCRAMVLRFDMTYKGTH